MKKTGQERSQAVERELFRWTDARMTRWFPFRGVAKSGRVRKKGPDNETWSLSGPLRVRYMRVGEQGVLARAVLAQAHSSVDRKSGVSPSLPRQPLVLSLSLSLSLSLFFFRIRNPTFA